MPIIDYPDWLPLAQKASKNMTLDTGFQTDQPAVGPAIFENQTDDLKVTWSLTWIFTYSCRLLASFGIGWRWRRFARAQEMFAKRVIDAFREHTFRFHFQLNEEWVKPCIGPKTVLAVNFPANYSKDPALVSIHHFCNFQVAELRTAWIKQVC